MASTDTGGFITKAFLIFSCSILLLTNLYSTTNLYSSSGTESQAATLAGRWTIEFTLGLEHQSIQFDAQASGEATFLVLDRSSNLAAPANPTRASWSLKGQSPAIYLFSISGEVEVPAIKGGRELAGLDFQAVSDLFLPITSLRGSGHYHPPRDPDDTRGNEDPTFDFTGKRVNELIVHLRLPNPGERLRRGEEARIEWEVQTALPLASQKVLISLDGGNNFIVIAPSIDGDTRSFVWAVPKGMSRTKKALLKVLAIDQFGESAEGLSAETFRIK